jgi:hypothetical protein
MRVEQKFCPACAHEVRVALTDEPPHDGQAPMPDAELVCLEISEPCGDATCPLLGVPTETLRYRLAHDGFDTSTLLHVTAVCAGCGRATDLVALDSSHVYCTECGAVGYEALRR